MATKTWLGGTSTDVNTGANWSGGTVPGAADDVIWNSITTYAMASGTMANDLTSVTVTDGAGTMGIGTSGGTCTFANVTTMQIASRAAAHWITSNATITTLKLEMPNGATAYIQGGTVTTCVGNAVKVEVAAAATLTTALSNGATWNVEIKGTAITTWKGTGFITSTSRNITNCYADPGSIVTLKGTSIIATLGHIIGATVNHQSSGTLSGMELRNKSLLTCKGNPNSTTAAGTVTLYQGSRVIDVADGCTMSYTPSYVGPQLTPSGGLFS